MNCKSIALFVFAALSLLPFALAQDESKLLTDPIKIDAGLVSGTTVSSSGKEVRIYRGIPYAAPPVGDLRWKPPQPVAPWSGTRECTKFSPWAAQSFPTTPVFESRTESGMSEDCLYLNVLTPAKKASERLPVLVWIHGGRLDILSGNMETYNTPELPAKGAVVVTISHRLGAFGYLAHPWLTAESPNHASGHYGQLDLIAALKWVQKNVGAFGGDPQRVTIFGQSGGGRKVNWLMASPLVSPGLFHRAICHSGSIDSIPLKRAEQNGEALAKKLGAQTLADLRKKTWQEIVKAGFSAQFVEDGWSLLEPITETFRAGKQQDVPYMIGMVKTEDAGHFSMPIKLVPTIKQRNSPVYAYLFTAVPAGWRKDGVTGWHAIDLSYLFSSLDNTLGKVKRESFAANAQRQGAKSMDPGITDEDRRLSEAMKTMWVQFAATGNPNVDGLVKWPAYKPSTDDYLQIDVPLKVQSGFSKLTQDGRRRER